MVFKAVIFDLDGTLCELRFRVSDAKEALIEGLDRLGFNTFDMSPDEPTQMILDKVALQLHEHKRGATYRQIWKRFNEIFTKFEMQAFGVSRALRGAKPTLKYLSDHALKLAVVTNNGTIPTKKILKKLTFSLFFVVVITRDDVKRMKPKGDGIRAALDRLGVHAHDALYVGDSYVDVMAARDAGVKVAALVRPDSATRILREAPDYLVKSLGDLLKIVRPSS